MNNPPEMLKVPESHVDFFLPYQLRWIEDQSDLKIMEKSRQIGISYADAYDSVLKASGLVRGMSVWVSSRDEETALLYLAHCKYWARVLNIVAEDLGERIVNPQKDIRARLLRFNSGFSLYSLSSVPDAAVSRSGHIKLDEFAIRQNQDEVFRVSGACSMWGGQLAIISTHRSSDTVFNKLIRSIKEEGNPMKWSHHRVSIHDAVDQGIVERINTVAGRNETRAAFLERMRAKCLDEEQWLREFCCQPVDDAACFITWEMITQAECPNCLKPVSYLSELSTLNPHRLSQSLGSFYVGVDVGRKQHLTVIDVGEKIGDVIWDRLRIELQDKTFSEIEYELWRILKLRAVKRCCIDATGLGMQLGERAHERFPSKVEAITFKPETKNDLACLLKRAFEDRKIRINIDPKLRADLRGVKKVTTSAGYPRYVGESQDSHCDRFWAMGLRQHAASLYGRVGGGLAL